MDQNRRQLSESPSTAALIWYSISTPTSSLSTLGTLVTNQLFRWFLVSSLRDRILLLKEAIILAGRRTHSRAKLKRTVRLLRITNSRFYKGSTPGIQATRLYSRILILVAQEGITSPWSKTTSPGLSQLIIVCKALGVTSSLPLAAQISQLTTSAGKLAREPTLLSERPFTVNRAKKWLSSNMIEWNWWTSTEKSKLLER